MTGPSVWIERTVGIAYHVAIVLGVMALMSRFGRRASTTAGIISTAMFLWFIPPAYAWLGGIALLIWSLALLSGKTIVPRSWSVLV